MRVVDRIVAEVAARKDIGSISREQVRATLEAGWDAGTMAERHNMQTPHLELAATVVSCLAVKLALPSEGDTSLNALRRGVSRAIAAARQLERGAQALAEVPPEPITHPALPVDRVRVDQSIQRRRFDPDLYASMPS